MTNRKKARDDYPPEILKVKIPEDIEEYCEVALQTTIDNKGDIRLGREFAGAYTLVIILNASMLPHVFKDKKKIIKGKEYYEAIINNAAGEHKIYIEKSKLKYTLTRDD